MDAGQISKLRYQAQLTLERICPATVTIDTVQYPAATRGLGKIDQLTDNGFVYDFDIVFRVRKEILQTAPVIGKTVRWQNANYRIDKVPNRPDDCAWFLGCKSPNR